MSSSGQANPNSQREQRTRKPPFADWPTIKILTPPQGRFSPKRDEWCLTYCSQSVTGRINHAEPSCRSICVRKVFPHEVRNLIAFKNHRNLDADGKAKYPLPSEGQPENVPRYLGGKKADDDPDAPAPETKYWNEGWYFHSTKGRTAAHEQLYLMTLDLERQQKYFAEKQQRKELWQDYEDQVRRGIPQDEEKLPGQSNQLRAPIPPGTPRPLPDFTSDSLLVPLPPDVPSLLVDRLKKVYGPFYHSLDILGNTVQSGELRQFGHRVWEKAWSKDPFILAGRTLDSVRERWGALKDEEEKNAKDDPKKGAP